MTKRTTQYSLQTVQKTLDVLAVFEDGQTDLTLTDISQRVGASVTVVFRILRTLCEAEYLERDPRTKRYYLGTRLWKLAVHSHPHSDLITVAQSYLDTARNATRETAALGVMSNTSLLYPASSPGLTPLQAYIEPGTRVPAFPSASGRVLLAFSHTQVLDSIIAEGLEQFTEATVTDPGELRECIQTVRSTGVAVVHGEFTPHMSSVAVPVRDMAGTCLAGMAVAGLTQQFTPDRVELFTATLHDLSQELTAALGRSGRHQQHAKFSDVPEDDGGGAQDSEAPGDESAVKTSLLDE